MFGLPQVALGDAVIISVLAVAFLDDLQGLAVQVHRLPVIMLVKTHLRVAGQRRSVMGAVLKMTVAVDLQRLRRMPARGGQLVFGEQRQRQIRVRRGHVEVGFGIRARRFQYAQGLAQLHLGLMRFPGLAVQHRQVVVQGGESPVAGGERALAGRLRLLVQILGLVVLAGRPHGGGRIDQGGRPCLGARDAHTGRELQRPLHDPLVLLVSALRAVEPHRLVQHGEQPGVIAGVLRVDHGLLQVRPCLGGGVRVEDRVEPGEEPLRVKRLLGRSGLVPGLVRCRVIVERGHQLRHQCIIVHVISLP